MTSIRWPSRSTASTRCSYPLVVAAKPPGNNPSILDNAGLPKTHNASTKENNQETQLAYHGTSFTWKWVNSDTPFIHLIRKQILIMARHRTRNFPDFALRRRDRKST